VGKDLESQTEQRTNGAPHSGVTAEAVIGAVSREADIANELSIGSPSGDVVLNKKTLERTALRRIFDASKDAVVVVRLSTDIETDARNLFLEVNSGFEREFGFARDEVIGKDIRDLNLWVEPSTPGLFLRELFEKGIVQNMEAQLRRRNGESIECLLSGTLVDLEDERCAVVFGRNLSELKDAQRTVLEREQTFQTLFHAQLDSIITLDVFSGRYIDVNDEFLGSTGYSREEVIGQRSREFNLFTEEAQADKLVDGIKQHGEVRNLEMTFRHKDGFLSPCLVSAKLLNLRGRLCCVIFARKIRELKEAQRELIKAREAALAASRAKSEFLSSMSHEIRTPMNAVLGMAELLDDTPLTEEQRRFVNIMRGNGEALLDLINDILDLAKIESGRLAMESAGFDLEEQLGRVAEMMAIRAHQKGLELALRISPEVPTKLVGDSLRLRQILINLVGNAIKFTERGEVVIEVGRTESATTDPSRPIELRFSVTDTGSGIPADKLDLIFSRFTQADSSTSREYGGSGLGLAIVKRLVELYGGAVSVQSEYGKGSCFSFSARFGHGSATHSSQPETPVNLKGVRALIIDDVATNRVIMREILSRAGAHVHEAASGEEGLARLAEARGMGRPYQLLLLDCRMPGIDGLEVARQLRAVSHPDDIPAVVMLTSEDLAERVARLRDIGITTYVVKPVRRSDLMSAIASAMNMARLPEPVNPDSLLPNRRTPCRRSES
jgi:PAS domain S-box-containing protein